MINHVHEVGHFDLLFLMPFGFSGGRVEAKLSHGLRYPFIVFIGRAPRLLAVCIPGNRRC